MSTFIAAYLINSIGSVLMWIMLGPFVVARSGDIAVLGHLGMMRQLSFIGGAILGGILADQGRPMRRQLVVEIVQFSLALVMLVLIDSSARDQEWAYLTWSILRFGIGGISFVLGFKVLAQTSPRIGNASTLHLFVTQGATLVAPLAALLLPLLSRKPLHLALIVDSMTTLGYVVILLKACGGEIDQHFEDGRHAFFTRLKVAITSFWDPRLRPWNTIQFLLLVAMSGYAVISLETARRQTWLPVEIAYALCSFIYGLALWVTGSWLKSVESFRSPILLGAFLLGVSGLTFLIDPLPVPLLVLSYLLYVFGFWIALHSSNMAVLATVSKEHSGITRSSMVFYLSVIFGLGELALGSAFSSGCGALFLAMLRISVALVIFVLFSFLWKASLYEAHNSNA